MEEYVWIEFNLGSSLLDKLLFDSTSSAPAPRLCPLTSDLSMT